LKPLHFCSSSSSSVVFPLLLFSFSSPSSPLKRFYLSLIPQLYWAKLSLCMLTQPVFCLSSIKSTKVCHPSVNATLLHCFAKKHFA
jgi:hypothetical protein